MTDAWWDSYERRVRNRQYAELIERTNEGRPGIPPVVMPPKQQRRSTARALSGLIAAKMVRDNAPLRPPRPLQAES